MPLPYNGLLTIFVRMDTSTSFKTYYEVVTIIQDELNAITNIKEFCKANGLNYTRVIAVRGRYKQPYPLLAKRLLELFGYDVQLENAFKLTKKKP